MQIFKVTVHCENKEHFNIEELKELLSDYSIMKVKTNGVKVGKIEVEEIQSKKGASK